jgi:hypothetical protein
MRIQSGSAATRPKIGENVPVVRRHWLQWQ